MASATTVVYESGFQYTLSVVPLFILMGNFVTRAGMSKELYRAGHAFVGHLRGGLAMATVLACAGFGAICGSSIATAATMTKVAYPSMSDHRYSDELVGRRDRRGRHARHPDPAVDHHGHLRDHDQHQHRQAVRRRHAAGAGRGAAALPRGAATSAGATRTAGRAAERATWRERFDALSRTSGPSPCSSSSSWAASTAASSRRPKAPASARSARSASRWRGASST